MQNAHPHLHPRVSYAVVGYYAASAVFLGWYALKVHKQALQHDRLLAEESMLSNWNVLLVDPEKRSQIIHGFIDTFRTAEFSMFALFNYACSSYMLMIEVTKLVFLGRLTVRESSRMSEVALSYMAYKLLFLLFILAPHRRNLSLWTWYVMVGYVRVFMHMAQDRLDTVMSSAPPAGGLLLRELRTLGLLIWTLGFTVVGMVLLWQRRTLLTASQMAVLGYDAAVAIVAGVKALLRYGVHVVDRAALYRSSSRADSDGGWDAWDDGKGKLLYHGELVADLAALSLSLMHCCHCFALHGVMRVDVTLVLLVMYARMLVVKLRRRLTGYLRYRTENHILDHSFPAASPEEIQGAGGDCAICCQQMRIAKKLPCSHVFHLSCLRAWLLQSGEANFNCPICRSPLCVRHQQLQPGQQHIHNAALAPQHTVLSVLRAMLLSVLIGTPWPQPLQPAAAQHQAGQQYEEQDLGSSSQEGSLESEGNLRSSTEQSDEEAFSDLMAGVSMSSGHVHARSWGTTITASISAPASLVARHVSRSLSGLSRGRSRSTAAAPSGGSWREPRDEDAEGLEGEVQSPAPPPPSHRPPRTQVRSGQSRPANRIRVGRFLPPSREPDSACDREPSQPASGSRQPEPPVAHRYNTRRSAQARSQPTPLM